MSEILKLEIITFCTLENDAKNTLSSEEMYFKGNGKLSAHGVCAEHIRKMTVAPYLAWDGNVYPQFKVSKVRMMSDIRKYGYSI